MADEESIAYDLQDEFESKAKGFGKGKYGRILKMAHTPSREESDVYVETLDVEVNGTEVASGAVGPHKLDAAHDIHEAWAGVGFGLERLLMLANGKSSVRKTGKSNTYLDGFKID